MPTPTQVRFNPGREQEVADNLLLQADWVVAVFSLVMVGTGQLVRESLTGLRYLGPNRQVPLRDFAPPRTADPTRWANGLAGWDLLHAQPELVARVSRLLSDSERFNLGYELQGVSYHEFESGNPLIYRAYQARLEEIEEPLDWLVKARIRTRLQFRPLESPEVYLDPADLGVGIGQMIPVIAAALDAAPTGASVLPVQLMAVEHPELNLHPRLQAELGDVFLEGALAAATTGRIIFIETHSEHLVLRLLRRIREANRAPQSGLQGNVKRKPRSSVGAFVSGGRRKSTTTGEMPILPKRLPIPVEDEPLNPDDIGVWYVDRRGESMTARRILVDVEGEFVQPWPEDDTLFEQDFRERYT